MYVIRARTHFFRNTSGYPSFLAVILLFSACLVCAQNSQPNACHVDSDGFCLAETVEATPVVRPAPESKVKVEFLNDRLRLDAENITLRDALKAVSARTGAEIQFPAGALGEHIFVHLGPGTPRDVVTQLLTGSQFNYVILSSPSEPAGVVRVILSRSGSDHAATSEARKSAAVDPALPQLYGSGFGEDPDAPVAEAVPSQEPITVAPIASQAAAGFLHPDGSKLSGEELDRIQKMQIQQEQQQFALQLQQQRETQPQQPPPSTPSQ
jgi:hypothetical protein